MRKGPVAGSALLFAALAVAGFLLYRDTLVPVPLAEGRTLFVPANPEFEEDAAEVQALMPPGPGLETFLANQSDLTLIERTSEGWTGQLVAHLRHSRHGRRWRLEIRPGWRMQDGSLLDAAKAGAAIQGEVASLSGEVRPVDAMTLDLKFRTAQDTLPDRLTRWRIPGSGPFLRRSHTLIRHGGFAQGRAGIARLEMLTDPALMESRAWAEGLAAGRWAWAVFPGHIAPEDMARVRLAPYDELRMKDGSVWFLSRRMRRLRPVAEDWTRTRLFGVWRGAMDLPYDPLGM
jgi:hypothetical protein